jgi:hypothetical protein
MADTAREARELARCTICGTSFNPKPDICFHCEASTSANDAWEHARGAAEQLVDDLNDGQQCFRFGFAWRKKFESRLLVYRKRVLEEAARANCWMCRDNWPMFADFYRNDLHDLSNGKTGTCQSWAIRNLLAAAIRAKAGEE